MKSNDFRARGSVSRTHHDDSASRWPTSWCRGSVIITSTGSAVVGWPRQLRHAGGTTTAASTALFGSGRVLLVRENDGHVRVIALDAERRSRHRRSRYERWIGDDVLSRNGECRRSSGDSSRADATGQRVLHVGAGTNVAHLRDGARFAGSTVLWRARHAASDERHGQLVRQRDGSTFIDWNLYHGERFAGRLHP